MKIEKDMINSPSHYTHNKYEAIDVIEDTVQGLEPVEAVLVGNIIKYILRWKWKNGIQDCKKAQWYLNRLIQRLEKEK